MEILQGLNVYVDIFYYMCTLIDNILSKTREIKAGKS